MAISSLSPVSGAGERHFTSMVRFVAVPFALVLFAVGAVLTPTPLPFGIPLMAIAVFLLIGSSKFALRLVRRTRRKLGWLDEGLSLLESKVTGAAARTFRRSRPSKRPNPPQS